MTTSASLDLRKSAREALLADAPLVAALGGPRVYDEAPRGAETPYVTLGDAISRDWSTIGHRGQEHALVFDVWSGARGAGEALAIAARVVDLLHESPLGLDVHHLVNLRHERTETRRESNGRFTRASVRFRAVTEAP